MGLTIGLLFVNWDTAVLVEWDTVTGCGMKGKHKKHTFSGHVKSCK